MSLVLTLREGHSFYVEDRKVVVSKIISATDFELTNDQGDTVAVSEIGWKTILPGVEVQAGIPRELTTQFIRVAIKAEGKKVLRGDLYHAEHGNERPHRCGTCGGKKKLVQPKKLCSQCKGHGCKFCKHGFVSEEFPCPDC